MASPPLTSLLPQTAPSSSQRYYGTMRRGGTQCSRACEGAPAPGFKTWEEETASQGQGGALPGSEEEGKLPTSLLSGQWDWNRVDETGIVTQPFQCVSRHWGSEGPVSPEGT